ncbi:hypothetical protein NFI96_009932 [Prochilodus magdalenae]|nr:hypothetical protein NFI96_009932 [Prochilodus magdalenae]
MEDFYGSPEVIENALLKKVKDLPKISVKDNHKLRELGDILMDLEAAKRTDPVLPPPGEHNLKDLYSKQWKQVQALADAFWKRWHQEYLVSLQPRRNWHLDKPNLAEGDVVLLKDTQVKRNERLVGVVVNAILSKDSKVHKVDIK